MRAWQGVVFELVREEGASKRTTARLASLGVNGAGLTVMLAVFAHTGGLTGAEVVVAGGTSAVGQKLLEAIFGDQAVRALAARAARIWSSVLSGCCARRRRGSTCCSTRPRPRPTASRASMQRSTRSVGRHDGDARRAARRAPARPPSSRPAGSTTRPSSCARAVVAKAGRGWARPRVDGRRARGPDGRREVAALQRASRGGARGGWPPQADHVDGSGGRVGRRRRGAPRLARDPAPAPARGGDLDGLVLLDLPDFDSVESAHRLEVDRIVELADLVVWVVEPQKYADAALHERYLRPLASHAAAMAVVLNQADLLAPAEVDAWRGDMRRLLGRRRLKGVPLAVVSAATGEGLAELRAAARPRQCARGGAGAARCGPGVRCRRARRVVRRVPCRRCREGGSRSRSSQRSRTRPECRPSCRAVADAHRRRGSLATGWPFVRWVRRFRPDPLRRLRLPDRRGAGRRTSLPPPTDVQRAQVATPPAGSPIARQTVCRGPGPASFATPLSRATTQVADRLDRAVGGTDLRVTSPRWWSVAGLLQWALAVAVLAGALWLLVLAVLAYLRLDDVIPVPESTGSRCRRGCSS